MNLRIGSLFSGIGGLELGLEAAGVGSTVWQVESDAFCRAVLAKHWPDALRYEDVNDVGEHNLATAELVCGGFPCQDVSSAGKRAGLAGARSGLWFEYLRIVRELRPDWVVVENVASGALAWVDVVVEGLGELGYVCFPVPIDASDVGAPHERARIFVVACHSNANRKSVGAKHAQMARLPSAPRRLPEWSSRPDLRVDDGLSRGMGALGNAVVPQCAEVIGHVIRQIAGDTTP